jgi:hypothetical protein
LLRPASIPSGFCIGGSSIAVIYQGRSRPTERATDKETNKSLALFGFVLFVTHKIYPFTLILPPIFLKSFSAQFYQFKQAADDCTKHGERVRAASFICLIHADLRLGTRASFLPIRNLRSKSANEIQALQIGCCQL